MSLIPYTILPLLQLKSVSSVNLPLRRPPSHCFKTVTILLLLTYLIISLHIPQFVSYVRRRREASITWPNGIHVSLNRLSEIGRSLQNRYVLAYLIKGTTCNTTRPWKYHQSLATCWVRSAATSWKEKKTWSARPVTAPALPSALLPSSTRSTDDTYSDMFQRGATDER